MALEVKHPLPPMEARSVPELPVGPQWQYEPKWDGFRCLVFRDGKSVYLQSKSGQPLARYFPELVEIIHVVPAKKFVLDGEIVVPVKDRISFDELLLRVHPAESRIRMLSAKRPAMYITFDLLCDQRGKSLLKRPLQERRKHLEQFAAKNFRKTPGIRLSPATGEAATARRWFASAGGTLDGVVAKRRDLPYRSGKRDAMQKYKHRRTADCVVGGFRYATRGKLIGSLLLGLYDAAGKLNHVGFTSSFTRDERSRITRIVEPLKGGEGFTGNAPGGPSRWSTERSTQWEPVRTRLVVEVEYDHFTGGRFRHGTKFVRLRPDKKPKNCTIDQLKKGGATLKLLAAPQR